MDSLPAVLSTRELLAYRDAPEGSFAVTQNLGMTQTLVARFPRLAAALADETGQLPDDGPAPRSILVNGKSDSSTFYDRETLKLLAHLPALWSCAGDQQQSVFHGGFLVEVGLWFPS